MKKSISRLRRANNLHTAELKTQDCSAVVDPGRHEETQTDSHTDLKWVPYTYLNNIVNRAKY